MDDIKLNVKALASYMGLSIRELADACGINENHLVSVNLGRATMTAVDIVKLSKFTKIPVENIKAD